MVVIFSNDSDELTLAVQKWLEKFKVDYCLIDHFKSKEWNEIYLRFVDVKCNLGINKKEFQLWYRKTPDMLWESYNSSPLEETIAHTVNSQNLAWFDYLHYKACKERIFIMGRPYTRQINKLIQLDTAKSIGMDIPETYICSKRKDLTALLNLHKEIIVKPYEDQLSILFEGVSYMSMTHLITKKEVNGLPKSFSPILCQKYIHKKMEIRCAYIDGVTKSIALINQNKQDVMLDSRNHILNTLVRVVPYNLPLEVKRLVTNFMKRIGSNFGMIDIVVNEHDKHFFLEANLEGQVSGSFANCNIDISKEIAMKFIKNEYRS